MNIIQQWHDMYFLEDEVDGAGPFEALEEALNRPEFHFSGTPKPELSSDVVPVERLLQMGRDLVTDEGDSISINGKQFLLVDGRLVERTDR